MTDLTIDFNGVTLKKGDSVISYDFPQIEDWGNFVFGTLEDFTEIEMCPCGEEHFVIRVSHRIVNGDLKESFKETENFMVYPPANGSKVVKVESDFIE